MTVPHLASRETLPSPVQQPVSYWVVLRALIAASPLLTVLQLLPPALAMTWLTANFPNAATQPALVAVAAVSIIALSFVIVAVPSNPAGAVLLAETGRPAYGFWMLLAAAWKGTLVQLVTMTAALFAWAFAVGHIARYAVVHLGTPYETAEATMMNSVWFVGGVIFVKLIVTSALTMVDVQFGGPPTIMRSIRVFYRAPFRATGATFLALGATVLASMAISEIGSFLDPDKDFALLSSALQLAIASWFVTVAVFAHYRIAFGANGAG